MATTTECDEKNMPKEAGGINGGLFKRDENAKNTLITINVASIEDHLKKIEEAGGKTILPKQTVGDFGFYARFQDTEGNLIGLWEDKK